MTSRATSSFVSLVTGLLPLRRDDHPLERRVAEVGAELEERRAALHASEQRYWRQAAVVASADDAIVATDLDDVVTTWNAGAERLYGYSAAEAIGSPLALVVPDDLEREVAGVLAAVRVGSRFDSLELRAATKGGGSVEVAVYPVRDDEGRIVGVSSIGRDTGEREGHVAELERVNHELAASNAELEAFSYSISHDLRAPLRAIDGFTRVLVEEHADELSPEAQRYLRLVQDGATRMGELVDGLLRFSRLGRQELERIRVDAAAIARAALADVRGAGAALVAIGELGPVDADPRLLRQVFANLIGNALKFTAGRPDARVEVGTVECLGQRAFFVRDEGVGFDMRYADRLFEVFQRLHRAEDYEGTGIGLALVRRIVERHGGRVWAEATEGKGATFFFTIPERTA